MGTFIRKYWDSLVGKPEEERDDAETLTLERPYQELAPEVEIAPDDPLLAYFLNSPGVTEIDRLNLKSPALERLIEAGVRVAVPLVSQGELIGVLYLGPRLSEQEYSADDRRLLNNLATQAAPALRVAQLVRQQQAEARERERLEQELRVARIIQQTLLPKEIPALPGYHLVAHWQPARAVGGDFYDFVQFPDGRLGLIIADVTDKGVPAAMVMATTRSILRAVAERLEAPGEVLERANNLLCPDIPNNMFVTCLYALLDPRNGDLVFANAGHNLPYVRRKDGVQEHRATGMPLGLMEGMSYEEKQFNLGEGESLLLSSDGLIEAHNPEKEMFGFGRVKELMAQHPGGEAMKDFLLAELHDFTGEDYEQEDDITLVILQREAGSQKVDDESTAADWRKLEEFSLESAPGNERRAVQKVAEAIEKAGLLEKRIERLKTAVAEATMNAMEHGNHYDPDLEVKIAVQASAGALSVRITDHGGNQEIPEHTNPDLDAKLAGTQSPRGWGLFLIKNMVDKMHVTSDGDYHVVELIMFLEGGDDGN